MPESKSSKYTADEVVAGFGGAVTFSADAAKATAAELNKAGDLGAMAPDVAAKAVREAVKTATGGLRVSIDTAGTALATMHAIKARQGVQIGPAADPDATPATGGTAAAAGGASQGAGAGAV